MTKKETFTITIDPRETKGKQVRQLRRQGLVPVVIYGQGTDPVLGQVAARTFQRLYADAGESSLVNVTVGSHTIPTLIQDVTYEPISDDVHHVDFLHVDMKKEVQATVQLKHIGIAPAIKEFGGVVVTPRDHVKIKCLPTDLVHEIEIDLSTLTKIGDSVHVKDLAMPAGIRVEEDPSIVLVMISAPRTEEVAKTAEVAAVPGAAPAEGAAAPAAGAAPAAAASSAKK